MITNQLNIKKIIKILNELKQKEISINIDTLYKICIEENIDTQDIDRTLRTMFNMGIISKENNKILFINSKKGI